MGSVAWVAFFITLFLWEPSAADVPAVSLNDGHSMPGFGFGTWLGLGTTPQEAGKDDSVEAAVEAAIDSGYRHIDTAAIYNTEAQVGRAVNKKISEGAVKREDLFITTKLWNDKHARSAVIPALKESLSQLHLEYVDLYLIHWPMAQYVNGSDQDIDYLETWQGMVDARDAGLARSVGVSNFNQEMLERLIKESGVKPAVLQVEVNLNLQQPALRQYCREQDIAVMGYTPFGSLFAGANSAAPPPRVGDSALVSIADKYHKTVAQVVLRYLVQLGVTPIPKTVSKTRAAENFDIFDFQLTDDDMATLRAFDKGYRVISFPFWSHSRYFPFEKTAN